MRKFATLAAAAGIALSAPLAFAQAPTVDDAVAAVNASADVSAVEALTAVGAVTVLTTGSLEGDTAALDAAVTANADGLAALRAAIAANAALAVALEAQMVSIDSVVGIAVTDAATGAVTVYVTG